MRKNFYSQQVVKNFFIRSWERCCKLCRAVINFFTCNTDTSDGANPTKSIWRCFFGFFRNKFSRSRRPIHQAIYPRLELPPYDLHFEYNMSHKNRGLALIFNHETFHREDKSKRTGTDKDRDRLTEVLKVFKFNVRNFEDSSFRAMVEELRKGNLPLLICTINYQCHSNFSFTNGPHK